MLDLQQYRHVAISYFKSAHFRIITMKYNYYISSILQYYCDISAIICALSTILYGELGKYYLINHHKNKLTAKKIIITQKADILKSYETKITLTFSGSIFFFKFLFKMILINNNTLKVCFCF